MGWRRRVDPDFFFSIFRGLRWVGKATLGWMLRDLSGRPVPKLWKGRLAPSYDSEAERSHCQCQYNEHGDGKLTDEGF